jgi:Fe-S-cluster containining protein
MRCGECCRVRGFVRVSAGEIDRMATFLGLEPRDFTNRFTRLAGDRQGLELRERENGDCVLLRGSDCLVHEAKPRQCSAFPHEWSFDGAESICPLFSNRGD